MPDIATCIENLSKLYRIGPRERYKALRDTLTDALYAPFRRVKSIADVGLQNKHFGFRIADLTVFLNVSSNSQSEFRHSNSGLRDG